MKERSMLASLLKWFRKLDRRLTKGVYQHGHDLSDHHWTEEMTRERAAAREMRGDKPAKATPSGRDKP
jgi:hypothetical protein